MAAPSLRRNFSWALAGNLAYSATQFGALILLAKLGSAEVVGRYSLGLAIAAPVVLLTNMKLRQVQATDQGGQYTFADYAGLRLLTASLACLVVAAIALLNPAYAGESALVIGLVGLFKCFEAVSDVAYGQYLRHERNDRMARSQVGRGLGTLAAIAVGLGLLDSLVAAVALQALAWGAAAVVDLWGARSLEADPHWRPRWHGPALRKVVWTAAPLGVVVTMGSLQTNVPRYAVEAWHGEAELGVFAALGYLLVIVGTVVNAMGLAASPRLARYWAHGERSAFLRLLGGLILGGATVGLAGVAVAAVAGEPLLRLLFTADFAGYGHVLVRMMIAAAITSSFVFLGTAINAMRLFKLQVPVQFAGLVCIIALTVLWVPAGGALGAANALIGAALVTMAIYVPLVAWLLVRVDPAQPRR